MIPDRYEAIRLAGLDFVAGPVEAYSGAAAWNSAFAGNIVAIQ